MTGPAELTANAHRGYRGCVDKEMIKAILIAVVVIPAT
jgi:hypothetical protein